MNATDIPDAIISHYSYIPREAWTKVSERRYRAEHPSPDTAVLVVRAFGTTISQGVQAGEATERETFARLLGHAARLAAHRMACEERTPIVRPDTEANRAAGGYRSVVGCCWWCGALPEQHTGDPTISVRTEADPGDVLVLAESDGTWLLRPVGDPIGSCSSDGTVDAPPPWGLRSAEAAGYVVTGWRRAWVLTGHSHPDLEGGDAFVCGPAGRQIGVV